MCAQYALPQKVMRTARSTYNEFLMGEKSFMYMRQGSYTIENICVGTRDFLEFTVDLNS